MSVNSVQPQKPARPRNLVIIVVALGLIAALSALGLLVTGFGLGRPAFNRGNQPGNFQGGNNSQGGGNFQGGGNPQGGSDNPQAGNGGNFQGGNGNFQRRGGANLFSIAGIARTLGINFQYIRYITIAFGLLGIALTTVTAVFVWKQKRWALNLAIVLAILFLLGSLPGFFNFGRFFSVFTVLTASSNILKGLATLPIIVLGILPSVRDLVS
jgi:hypothetical protein